MNIFKKWQVPGGSTFSLVQLDTGSLCIGISHMNAMINLCIPLTILCNYCTKKYIFTILSHHCSL